MAKQTFTKLKPSKTYSEHNRYNYMQERENTSGERHRQARRISLGSSGVTDGQVRHALLICVAKMGMHRNK